jgi:2'-5' RNA ligase
MKKRRIFLAINLPTQIKKKLSEFQKEWADLPVRWTKENNLHITLIFIGYVSDEEMLEICRLTRQIAQQHQPTEIKLERVCLGPPDRPARMIWIEGEKNPGLVQLKNDLEEALLNSAKSGYRCRENRPFRPHITLARIKQEEWRCLPTKPKINKEISLVFPVTSIEVMQSHLSRGGSDYAVLESAELAS